MGELPTIKLDTTLCELYSNAGLKFDHQHLGHIHSGLTSACDLTDNFPLNKRSVYLDSSLHASISEAPTDDAKRSLAIKMLSLVPQRDGFISGRSKVICFHTGSSSGNKDMEEFSKTTCVLENKQRPEPLFCNGPGEIAEIASRHNISSLSAKVLPDGLVEAIQVPNSSLHSLVDIDEHWYLNSKVGLARSGLPTPSAQVFEVGPIEDKTQEDRRGWMDRSLNSLVSAINSSPLPFVVKGNQTFGGSGTWIITSQKDRESLVKELSDSRLLEKLLSFVERSNEHLQIGTFLLMDMVEDPVQDIGLTFFVNADGSPVFLGASEQMIDQSSSAWVGSTITYSSQEQLREKLSSIMYEVAAWLHSHRYIGPAGADILESSSGEMSIVDLNVRTTGSLCLPLLCSHFTERELDAASSFSIAVSATREEFIAKWSEEFERGFFIIVAWYEQVGCDSLGDIVVGAKDEESLKEVIARVKDGSDSVTF